mmetsp:Transcript_19116/g.43518  ORF Transcript_19116/g.43518 Transcript_19116/m.43518 type:complete len:276 (+) Transcript_19116:145-972(+)
MLEVVLLEYLSRLLRFAHAAAEVLFFSKLRSIQRPRERSVHVVVREPGLHFPSEFRIGLVHVRRVGRSVGKDPNVPDVIAVLVAPRHGRPEAARNRTPPDLGNVRKTAHERLRPPRTHPPAKETDHGTRAGIRLRRRRLAAFPREPARGGETPQAAAEPGDARGRPDARLDVVPRSVHVRKRLRRAGVRIRLRRRRVRRDVALDQTEGPDDGLRVQFGAFLRRVRDERVQIRIVRSRKCEESLESVSGGQKTGCIGREAGSERGQRSRAHAPGGV